MLEIEKKLAAKQAVELEIECAIKRIYNRCNAQETMINTDVKKEMERIQQDLKEKEEDLEAMEKVNHALVIKEIKYRNEILDAREELITVSTLVILYASWTSLDIVVHPHIYALDLLSLFFVAKIRLATY